MTYKFERLEVWNLSLEYIDTIYEIAETLPRSEEYNLKSQIMRAATSIALNIAEGSTGQSDNEQARFIGMAIRSLLETIACLRLIQRRGVAPATALEHADRQAENLAIKLQAFRNALHPLPKRVREPVEAYLAETDPEQ